MSAGDRDDSRQPDEPGIDATVAGLTLEEKVLLLSGRDAWCTPPIERIGLPALKVTDGPNGARGDAISGSTAASFPVGTALGATWDVDLLHEVGAALAGEARSKGARILLGPTVNLHRSPLAGRNFECFSEDPLLTARLAIAYIDGLQGEGVGACIKHFVANDSEFERMTISSEVDERTLRELYLLPFERAVAEARPWSVMAAYNRINGTYACDHHELLVDVLKDEWGFDGLVISDWGAVHDAVGAANGGTDLEMPGPGQHFGADLIDAVKGGRVAEEVIDDKVRRLLRTIERAGLWTSGSAAAADAASLEPEAERSVDRPEDRELIRRAGVAGTVLLKNQRLDQLGPRVLPLDSGAMQLLAVIGPNAEVGTFQGGGSSIVRPHRVVHPLAAISERAGVGIEVIYEQGCGNERYLPEPDPEWFVPLDDEGRAFRIEYVDGDDPDGDAVSSRVVRGVTYTWWGPPKVVADPFSWSARWKATFVAPVTGPFELGVAAIGRSRVLLDGEVVVDNWTDPPAGDLFFGYGSSEVRGVVELQEGTAHELRIDCARGGETGTGTSAVRFGMRPEMGRGARQRAVDAARDADAAIVIVGTTGEWETEGSDRVDMRLPGDQDDLVQRVAAANPRTIVVLNTGSPVELPWEPQVPAIVQTWFPGQELGHVLADVLFGDADPGGRLPTTFPLRYEDHPALFNYPGENGEVRYGEGVFVGYRAYATRGQPVRYPFGHGLSYASFDYGEPTATPGPVPGSFEVSVAVTNTSDRAGTEVTQVYVRPPRGPLARPDLELEGFEKSELAPGETRTVTIPLDPRAFAAYDPALPGWRVEAGDYEIVIGSCGTFPASTIVTQDALVL